MTSTIDPFEKGSPKHFHRTSLISFHLFVTLALSQVCQAPVLCGAIRAPCDWGARVPSWREEQPWRARALFCCKTCDRFLGGGDPQAGEEREHTAQPTLARDPRWKSAPVYGSDEYTSHGNGAQREEGPRKSPPSRGRETPGACGRNRASIPKTSLNHSPGSSRSRDRPYRPGQECRTQRRQSRMTWAHAKEHRAWRRKSYAPKARIPPHQPRRKRKEERRGKFRIGRGEFQILPNTIVNCSGERADSILSSYITDSKYQ